MLARYLEHSRIYVFGEGVRQEIYLGSGDLLERNTRRRVEVFVQPQSQEIRDKLLHIMDCVEHDSEQSWFMHSDGSYTRVPQDGERMDSQMALFDYFAG